MREARGGGLSLGGTSFRVVCFDEERDLWALRPPCAATEEVTVSRELAELVERHTRTSNIRSADGLDVNAELRAALGSEGTAFRPPTTGPSGVAAQPRSPIKTTSTETDGPA